ncbi:glycosyltransferase [Escherichia coli]|jgi:glycosyltransferase involved in cell wall biosynthesis|nr:glycosyltransferase [Escherichia coli]EFA8565033.1 glycosyltransferase [Escherichia coli O157]EJT2703489.1 glycosyltransferase [Shigella sonnei]EEQ5618806.1 glycosyltransferase [Escherichia coli]EER0238101.1 glycosyltransferase [Escherichia coli]EER2978816.1 glycosyltransferase [Escherichia coli]
MNILIIIPKLCNGGIEKIASNFSQYLPERYNQFVYSIMSQDSSYDFAVKPIILNKSLGKTFIGKLITFFYRLHLARKIIRENNIDICISFGERCNIINILSMGKTKKIITIHSQLSIENKTKGLYGKVTTLFSKLLYKNADATVAVSEIVKKDACGLLNLDANNVELIYNGHDIDYIKDKSTDYKEFDTPVIDFVSVGRITYAKGHYHLLRSLAIVKETYPNVILYIVGTYEKDNLKSIIDHLIEKYDLYDNVIFTGFSDNPYPYIKSAKALILSSIFEGFPGVVIESIALGTPVIATDCGGASEVLKSPDAKIKNNTGDVEITKLGVLLPKFDGIYDINLDFSPTEKKMAQVMNDIISGKLKFNEDFLITKANEYDIDSMMKKYTDLIEKIK